MAPRLSAIARVLLLTYPPSIRRQYGVELMTALDDQWRTRPTFTSRLRLVPRLVADSAASWRLRRGRRSPMPPMRVLRNTSGDLRDALRLFRRSPGFAAGAVLTLAVGVGASTAIFSLADATILHPLQIPEPNRVVQAVFSWSYPDFREIEAHQTAFSQVAAWAYPPIGIEINGSVSAVDAAAVSGKFFALAGQHAVRGRLLDSRDDQVGGPAPVVISERLWQREFHEDASVVGAAVRINSRPATIVGVAPAAFRGLTLQTAPDVFLPLTSLADVGTGFLAQPGLLTTRDRSWLNWAGRLADGATVAQADAEARQIYAQARATPASPDPLPWFTSVTDRAIGARPRPQDGSRSDSASDLRRLVMVLLGATAVTLLLTCATVANLLLVRTERRRHEFSVRVALGAGRARLARLLGVESLSIGLAGTLLGAGVAALTLRLLSTFALPGQIAIAKLNLHVHVGMLAASAGLGVLTAAIFGMSPLWPERRGAALTRLRTSGRSTTGQTMRSTLIGVQVALCVLLLGGSAAFGRALQHALSLDLGFNTTDTLIASINPALARLDRSRADGFAAQVLERLRHDPRVRAAGWAALRPMSGNIVVAAVIDGYTPARDEDVSLQVNFVTAGYFDAIGIPIQQGRPLSEADRRGAASVAVISASLAARYWPAGNALGSRLSFENAGAADPKWVTIVGVAGDIHRAIGEPAPPIVYQPAAQVPGPFGETDYLFVQRTAGAALEDDLRALLHGVDPAMPITTIVPMATHVGATLSGQRLGLTLFVLFGGLAALLTGFGLYGVVAYAVAQRTREIAIRVALGAGHRRVLRLVLAQGLRTVGIGLAVGLAAFGLSAQLMHQFMFSVPLTTPGVLSVIAAGVALLAAAALAVPARRALAIDPAASLKAD